MKQLAFMAFILCASIGFAQTTTGTLTTSTTQTASDATAASATVDDASTCTVISLTPALGKATVIRFVTGPECPDPIVLTLDAVSTASVAQRAQVLVADKAGEAEQITRGLGGSVEGKALELAYQESIAEQARDQARLNAIGNKALFRRYVMEALRIFAAAQGEQ